MVTEHTALDFETVSLVAVEKSVDSFSVVPGCVYSLTYSILSKP